MMREHFNAFSVMLRSNPALSSRVFSNVRVVNGQPIRENYAVLFPDAPTDLQDDRYLAVQSRESKARWRYDVRAVAVDADGLLLLADAVLGVVGEVPVVADRRCDPISLVPGVEEGKGRFDPVTDLHYLDLSFEFWSRRAS